MAASFTIILVFFVWLLLSLKYFDAFPPLAQLALAVFYLVLGAAIFSAVSGTGVTGFWVVIFTLLFTAVIYGLYLHDKKAQLPGASNGPRRASGTALSRNLHAIKSSLGQLRNAWVGKYAVGPNAEARCAKVHDFCLEKGSDGTYRLEVILTLIHQDKLFASMRSDFFLNQLFHAKEKSCTVLKVNDRLDAGEYAAEEVSKWVERSLRSNGFTVCDITSIEHRLCEIVFMNYAEISWSSQSLKKIRGAAVPVLQTYEASFSNELLSANQETLRKASQIMTAETKNLESYIKECSTAMKKVYEFMDVPLSLRGFEKLDYAPFEVYQGRQDMRERIKEVIDIKNEYNRFRCQ